MPEDYVIVLDDADKVVGVDVYDTSDLLELYVNAETTVSVLTVQDFIELDDGRGPVGPAGPPGPGTGGGSASGWVILIDTDGVPYFDYVEPSVPDGIILIDTDGVAYYDPANTGGIILTDTDGVLYFDPDNGTILTDTDGIPYFAA